jgi:predicted acyltransferase (DUF342 family)
VSIRSDPLDRLQIPDGTEVEEHDLVTEGDVVVGGQSTVEFGVRGRNVYAGERVRFGGDIEADGDCRLDVWCDVEGNVLVGQDAYLGERVHVGGQLMVSGDLDIGDDVDIEDGFEANGWIVIRNPMPTIVFLFVYLSQLLRLGRDEDAEQVVDEFLTNDRDHEPVLVPRGARVSDDAWQVSTPATVGDDCRLHGNLRAETIEVGRDSELFGSLRARADIEVGPGTVIHGDVTTRSGNVRIAPTAHVRGDVACEDLTLHDEAEVDGSIRARGEMNIVDDPVEQPTRAEPSADASSPDDGPARERVGEFEFSAASDDDHEPVPNADNAAGQPEAEPDEGAADGVAVPEGEPPGPRAPEGDATPAVTRVDADAGADESAGEPAAEGADEAPDATDDAAGGTADDAAEDDSDRDEADDGTDDEDPEDPHEGETVPERDPAANGHGVASAIAEAEKR